MENVVNLSNYGKVKCGKITKAVHPSASLVYHYIEIPFAQPPIKNLRFLPPKKAHPWTGILCNKSQKHVPVQIMKGVSKYFQFSPKTRDFYKKHCSEDCLYLNVYVPKQRHQNHIAKLPVLVWFYGGGFQIGPQSYFDGTMLAGFNDIIVVVPNYRVNTFGFVSLGKDSMCKGNLGLLDQLQALRWVKECVGAFGGDENNVTIAGHSAGGISVHMHMLSGLSQGFFHKAISLSGTAAMSRVYIPDQSKATKKLLEILDIKETDPNLALKKLQSLSTEDIQNADLQLLMAKFAWFPTFDNYFFTESPQSLLSKNRFSKIPYMLGGTNSEGGWVMNFTLPSYLDGCTEDQYYQYCTPLLKWFDRKINPKKALPLLSKIYNDKKPSEDKMYYTNAIAGVMGNAYFMSGIPKVAIQHAATGAPTYCYHMTHAPRYSHDDQYGPRNARKPPNVGADHGDDVYLIWGAPFQSESLNEGFHYSEDEKALSIKLMTYIGNFTKTGNPNKGLPVDFSWPAYTPNERKHVVWDIPLKIGSNLAAEACYLYYDILPKL